MAEAKQGDKVKVHYTGRLNDGSVFDTSTERGPLEFTIGEGNLIPGFENAVIGMSEGETKVEQIAASDAYGAHQEEMVQTVDKSLIPPDIEIAEGVRLQVQQEGAPPLVVTVTSIGDEQVTLDGNHPLAGQDLEFEIQLVEIAA